MSRLYKPLMLPETFKLHHLYFENLFLQLYKKFYIETHQPESLVAHTIFELMKFKFSQENNSKPLWLKNLKQPFNSVGNPLTLSTNEETQKLLQLFNTQSLRGLPLTAQRGLMKWINKEYPLVFFEHLPTPMEVLELQCQGKRCISYFKNSTDFIKIYSGRDYLSFLIHDLTHADLFFLEPSLTKEMTETFCWILKGIQNKTIPHPEDLDNATMKSELEYIISDMNTHPQHIKQSLSSWGERHKVKLEIRN